MKIISGIIGTGIGKKHFEAIENCKNSETKILCEKNRRKLKILKKKYPKKILTDNENKIFKDKNINVVSIASYDGDHYKQIIKSIKFKKNIIVEKPMCLKPNQLKNIYNLLKKNKVKMISNLVLRVNSLFLNLKKKINKNKIYYIEADYIWGREKKLYGWRSKEKNYSVTLGAGIHMIDLVMWMLNNRPKYVTSFANDKVTKNSKFKKKSLGVYIFEFPSNILVKISANAASTYNHMHELKIFQKGSSFINNFNGQYMFNKINGKTSLKKLNFDYPDKKNRKLLIQQFIDSLRNKKKEIMNLKEQIDLMTVCFAADESIKKNKRIKIKYL